MFTFLFVACKFDVLYVHNPMHCVIIILREIFIALKPIQRRVLFIVNFHWRTLLVASNLVYEFGRFMLGCGRITSTCVSGQPNA